MIARWEQGGSAPSLETLLDLLAVCGFDLPLELADRDDNALDRLSKNALLSPERRVERMLRARAKNRRERGASCPGSTRTRSSPRSNATGSPMSSSAASPASSTAPRRSRTSSRSPRRGSHRTSPPPAALRELAGDRGRADAGAAEGTFTSEHGTLAVLWEPAGSRRGYTDLRRAASREPIGRGLRPPVASAADLAGMLGALDREEDRPTILALRRLIRLGA